MLTELVLYSLLLPIVFWIGFLMLSKYEYFEGIIGKINSWKLLPKKEKSETLNSKYWWEPLSTKISGAVFMLASLAGILILIEKWKIYLNLIH